jgi:hypothetical protein
MRNHASDDTCGDFFNGSQWSGDGKEWECSLSYGRQFKRVSGRYRGAIRIREIFWWIPGYWGLSCFQFLSKGKECPKAKKPLLIKNRSIMNKIVWEILFLSLTSIFVDQYAQGATKYLDHLAIVFQGRYTFLSNSTHLEGIQMVESSEFSPIGWKVHSKLSPTFQPYFIIQVHRWFRDEADKKLISLSNSAGDPLLSIAKYFSGSALEIAPVFRSCELLWQKGKFLSPKLIQLPRWVLGEKGMA